MHARVKRRMSCALWSVLATALVHLSAAPSRADPANDGLYLKRLASELDRLTNAVNQFDSARRALDSVEASVVDVHARLSTPVGDPTRKARALLKKHHPTVAFKAQPVSVTVRGGVELHLLRCSLSGRFVALRAATRRLRRSGVFIVSDLKHEIEFQRLRRGRFTISFTGRLLRLPARKANQRQHPPSRIKLYERRGDSVAQQIVQTLKQVEELRRRVRDIFGFEARVEAIGVYVKRMRQLSRLARDPFRLITRVLQVQLLRTDQLLIRKRRLFYWGTAPSRSAKRLGLRWLARRLRRRARLRVMAIDIPTTPVRRWVEFAASQHSGKRALYAAEARPIDLCALAGRRACVVARSDDDVLVTGVLRYDRRDDPAMQLAKTFGRRVDKLRRGTWLLLDASLPKPRAPRLTPRSAALRRWVRFSWYKAPLGAALGHLRRRLDAPLEAPDHLIGADPLMSLYGVLPAAQWIELIGAAAGLTIDQKASGTITLSRNNKPSTAVKRTAPPPPPHPSLTRLPIAELRVRITLPAGKRPRAIISTRLGAPYLLQRGSPIGRGRAYVKRISRHGVWIRMYSGIRGRLLLPLAQRGKSVGAGTH